MTNRTRRTFLIAAATMALVWFLAWTGYVLARNSKGTAERVNQYISAHDLKILSDADRAKALQAVIDQLNALSPEERRKWRFDNDWFRQMTDDEKSRFIEAVLPAEMRQALDEFEKMPKQKRQDQIDEALRQVREHAGRNRDRNNNNEPPELSPDLDKKVRTMGLKSVFSDSSAQTKAELMPLLLEVQRQFESGRGLSDF